MFGVTLFATGGPGNVDNGPVQAGFAIITPLAATAGSSTITVFANFGTKNSGGSQQAGITPSSLTTSAVVLVSASGRLSRSLGVAIVNPDKGNTNVTMTLRDEYGTPLGTKAFVLEGHHQIAKLVTELYNGEIPRDLTGTLSITSTSPVAVTGLRFRSGNITTLPITNLVPFSGPLPSPSTGVGGTGAVLLPHFVAGGEWATGIVIANTGSADMSVRLDLFKQDGTVLETTLNGTNASTFTNLTIPAGGVITIAPRHDDGDSKSLGGDHTFRKILANKFRERFDVVDPAEALAANQHDRPAERLALEWPIRDQILQTVVGIDG
jgi:hypothetical protein